jgi:hypothetical protein
MTNKYGGGGGLAGRNGSNALRERLRQLRSAGRTSYRSKPDVVTHVLSFSRPTAASGGIILRTARCAPSWTEPVARRSPPGGCGLPSERSDAGSRGLWIPFHLARASARTRGSG